MHQVSPTLIMAVSLMSRVTVMMSQLPAGIYCLLYVWIPPRCWLYTDMAPHFLPLLLLLITSAHGTGKANNLSKYIEARVRELLLKIILPGILIVMLFFIFMSQWECKIIQWIFPAKSNSALKDCPLESVIAHKPEEDILSEFNGICNEQELKNDDPKEGGQKKIPHHEIFPEIPS